MAGLTVNTNTGGVGLYVEINTKEHVVKHVAFTVVNGGNCITFVPTVPVLLPVRSASGSFSKKVPITKDNTPSMPLTEAHLGGFFILA